MLWELPDVRQFENEGFRRWFTDSDKDLILWYETSSRERLFGFQYCFGKLDTQFAVTWHRGKRPKISRIDDGTSGEFGRSPVLSSTAVDLGDLDSRSIAHGFIENASQVDKAVVDIVMDGLSQLFSDNSISTGGGSGTEAVLVALDNAFYEPAWHGPALFPELTGLSAEDAIITPPNRKLDEPSCGLQIAVHSAYWKRVVRRGLEAAGASPILDEPLFLGKEPVNNVAFESLPREAWSEVLESCREEHEILKGFIRTVLRERPSLLSEIEPNSGVSYAAVFHGVGQHDAYHCAQLRAILGR